MQSDRRLVALTRAGSSAAFSVIVERYREPLLGYTRRLVGPDEADDVLQQTFVNALGALRRDGRPIDVRPWLYRIAHNVSVNALRRSGRNYEQLDEQYDGVPQPPDVVDRKLAVHRLVEEINGLPERQRTAIVAHELEGRSYEEIARSMSATTPIVRQLVHRARTRLRDACGVIVPTWALRWLVVADLRTAGSERVGEAVAGGATGAGLLKAGTALLATGAIATGAGGLVISHHHAPPAGKRAEASAPKPVIPAPTSRPSLEAAAQLAPDVRPHGVIRDAVAKRGPMTHEVAESPVRHHRGPEQHAPVHPDRQGHDGSGDSSGDSHGPGHAGTIEASHDGSGESHGDGSTRAGTGSGSGSGSGRDSSSGDQSGDSPGASSGTDLPDGSGSPDSPASPPVEH